MPKTITDSEGNQIEIYEAQEIEAQKQEAVKAAIEPLQKELEQAKTDLSKASDKDYNFTQLRQRVEQAEQKIATAKEEAMREVEQNQATRTADSLIRKLADGDEELEKKIRLQYNRLGDQPKDEQEIAKKVRDAWALSRNEEAPNPLSGAFDSGGAAPVMPPRANPGKPPLSENQRNFLRQYANMSDEQIKTYDDAAPPVKFQSPDGNFGKVVI